MYIFLMLMVSISLVDCHYIHDILNHYELLDVDQLKHHVERRDLSTEGHSRQLHFKFAGTMYNVVLRQRLDILDQGFVAMSVDSEGGMHPFSVPTLQYYRGTVEGFDDSLVLAHIENDMVTAEIMLGNETIYIEPSKVHFVNKPSHMLVYKLSDVIWNLTSADTSVKLNQKNCVVPEEVFEKSNSVDANVNIPFIDVQRSGKKRNRRAVATVKNVCSLTLVADYQFFKNIGGGDKMSTLNYMIQVVSRVHQIYRSTNFDGIGINIGFKVEKVIIHESFSIDYQHSYNREIDGGKVWNVDQLLTVFSRTNFDAKCLSHLFTYQDFDNGIIGLAYVASASDYEVGGICTRSYRDHGGPRYLNCGLSSSVNWGRRLLTAEADLVTAHEIGHNFGSNHDPSSCQNSGDAGNYIMYAHSVSGEKENNNKFSKCSRHSMGLVLKSKRHKCFSEQTEDAFCGNLIVEKGEECDSGLVKPLDDCCDRDCKFKKDPKTNKPFVCSDSHDPCCDQCRLAPSTKVCRKASQFYCYGETKCSGASKSCPEAPGLDGREDCGFSMGNCIQGNCTSMCQQKGKISCPCSAGPDSCKICCKDSADGDCVKLVEDLDEANGIVCELTSEKGKCVDGACIKNVKDVRDEFSGLFEDFSFSKFVKFMEDNIVGTIITLSLFLWIPASCAVYYIDKKHNDEQTFMTIWKHPENKELIPKTMPGKLRNLFRSSKRSKQPVRTQYHITS